MDAFFMNYKEVLNFEVFVPPTQRIKVGLESTANRDENNIASRHWMWHRVGTHAMFSDNNDTCDVKHTLVVAVTN
jgi:hypothetical protein